MLRVQRRPGHIGAPARQRLARSPVAHVASVRPDAPAASVEVVEQALGAERQPVLEDPWEDSKWTKYKWTVYRGQAYDLTSFMDRHPAGNWLLNLAIGRDCTALFETYHLRPEVAVARLKSLPKLADFPVDAVPASPRPNDSELYNAIRERVRRDVFKGKDMEGAHRSGSEWAALAVLSYASLAYTAYASSPNVITGALLGLGGAWIGLTVQHCGNHGAMSTNAAVNNAMGLCDDLVGGSSLMWRYHHQVSHHIHCNDEALDEDVFSAFPLLRFDVRMPKHWWHQYQHLYMWLTFPFLQLGFQVTDLLSLLTGRTAGASIYGASKAEKATVLAGKLAHYSLLWFIPAALHGWAATLPASASYIFVQGVVLASTFAVSHNVPEAKPLYDNGEDVALAADQNLREPYVTRDWAEQQILTSANWGGAVGNFFTGGLNLQIEHHLFPAISFMHYPAISKVVREEAEKRGVNYASYVTLPEILGRFFKYMKEVGAADETPARRGGLSMTEVQSRKALVSRL